MTAKEEGKLLTDTDLESPGKDLNAYAAARILADHECSTVEEMEERLERGMYILLRQGSACHNLRTLLKEWTPKTAGVVCSVPMTVSQRPSFTKDILDNHLQICVGRRTGSVTAIRMATLNAAECFRLYDRGAIAPGYRADIVLLMI